MKKLLFLTTVFTLLLSSCAKYMDDKPGAADSAAIADSLLMLQRGVLTKERLTGIWVRPIATQPGDQGYHLYADGKLKFINMESMIGDTWELRGDTLMLFAHTERHTTPVPIVYRIYTLSDSVLELVPENAAPNYTERFRRKSFIMPERFATTFTEEFRGKLKPSQTTTHSFEVKMIFDGAVTLESPDKNAAFTLQKGGLTLTEAPARKFIGSFPPGKYTLKVTMSQAKQVTPDGIEYVIRVSEEDVQK
jgi:hypothetical protein